MTGVVREERLELVIAQRLLFGLAERHEASAAWTKDMHMTSGWPITQTLVWSRSGLFGALERPMV